ncbi:MAG: excinuclease ABC subunit C [Ignavibacteria bacterium RBG_16_34_14]|nr:MAG: excinuclease ABC subunit C [Ignavibacteria bacterium RBG_16_34_14]
MYYYVYILQSKNYPDKFYIGYTTNIKKRIVEHNEGSVTYTSKYKPWKINLVIAFVDKQKALSFEKYLKSHSGRAFSKKHF